MDESAKTFEVNGHRLVPGELAFMYRPESNDFEYGNVEAVTETHVLVSFEQPSWDRRDDAIEILLSNVYVAQDFNERVPEKGYTYGAKEWVFKRTSARTAEPLVVIARQESSGDPLLVYPARLLPNGTWGPAGEAFAVPSGDVYHPQLFSALQRHRFCLPVHPLFDIIRQQVGALIDKEQPGALRLKDIDVPVDVHIRIRGHEVEFELKAHYLLAGLLGGVASEHIVNETLTPRGGELPDWKARVAFSGASTHVGDHYEGTVSVIPRITEVVYADASVVATAEVYLGAHMSAWSSHIGYREPPANPLLMMLNHPPLPNAIQFECLGQPAIIVTSHRHEGIEHEYLSVIRLGEPLSEDDHSVLSAFIGYITGGRARNVITETFALNEKLKTTIHDRGEVTTRKQPPIPITHPGPHARIITESFATVLSEFKRWRTIDRHSFEAVFHHYAEGVDSNYPVTRVLRLSIALEAFINLVTRDKAENEKIITGDYEPLRGELSRALGAYAGEHRDVVSEEAQRRFETKIQYLNSGSNTGRIRKFWENVPISIDKDDEKLLNRLRNQSVHRGFLGDEDGDQDVLGDARDASRLCDILNRAILYYAKYTGPALSAENGRWLDIVTGGAFQLPDVPRGPTIEIRHEVPMPPLTADEQAAVEALRGVQR